MFIKAIFDAFEELIVRHHEVKICKNCNFIVDKTVLEHRLFDCMETVKIRNEIVKDVLKSQSDSLIIKSIFLNKLNSTQAFKWMSIVESGSYLRP